VTMPSSQLAFDISSPEDFLAKLKEEQLAVEHDLSSARHAINAALTAWHLIDWVWAHYLKSQDRIRMRFGSDGRDLDAFKQYLRTRCPALSTMHAICTGSKHVHTSKSDVSSTTRHVGGFSNEFSKEFDISRLKVVKHDGSTHWFDLELCDVVTFWESLFNEHFRHVDSAGASSSPP
jgi:hypothetical protein